MQVLYAIDVTDTGSTKLLAVTDSAGISALSKCFATASECTGMATRSAGALKVLNTSSANGATSSAARTAHTIRNWTAAR